MSGHGFASALAGDLDAYLTFKKEMGGRVVRTVSFGPTMTA